MEKLATTRSVFSHFREEDIAENRRPVTMREVKVSVSEEDDEVDAKTDDFVNKFKQQLQLQRLDSLTRNRVLVEEDCRRAIHLDNTIVKVIKIPLLIPHLLGLPIYSI